MPSEKVARRIVEQCDTSPAEDVDGHPDLFSDLEGERTHDLLMILWQKGLMNAQWNEEEEVSEWWATEFAVELAEKRLLRAYIMATEHELEIDASTSVLEGPNP